MIQIGNGNWAVKEDNLLGFRYDETEGVYFPREMTFGRACDATRVNPDGLIERVPYNLLQYSEEFNQSNWAKFDSSATANATIAPNDTTTADKFVEGTGSSIHRFIQGASIVAGQSYAFSVYAKAGERTRILVRTNNGSADQDTYFDLSSGSVVSGTGTITDAGNGWYRIFRTFTATTSTTSSFICQLLLVNSGTNTSYTGDGTSGVFVWGAQLNEGTTAKPYFPTTNRQDIARIDYSSGTGGLLLEPQRTNLATYSQTFDNSVWIAQDISTPTPNTAISPDGYTNAYTIEKAGGSGASGYFYTYRRITSNTTNTFSIFAKYKEGSGIIWLLGKNSATFAYFNLKTGTALSASAGMTTKIENYGNGWYKCSFIQDYTSATQYTIGVGLCLVDGTPNYNPTSAATQGIYIWGAQFEAGSYPTSYIPTTSSTVTRLADSCYKTGVADWIGQTEGTLFVDYQSTNNGGNGERIFAISDGTAANRIVLFDQLGKIRIYTATGSAVQWDTTTAINTNGHHKIAVGYKANDAVLYIDGTQITTDTSYSVPACSAVYVGTSEAYGISLAGSVNHATLYKTRLSNSELAALTTI